MLAQRPLRPQLQRPCLQWPVHYHTCRQLALAGLTGRAGGTGPLAAPGFGTDGVRNRVCGARWDHLGSIGFSFWYRWRQKSRLRHPVGPFRVHLPPILVQMASEIAFAAPSGAPMAPVVDLYRFFMVSVALGSQSCPGGRGPAPCEVMVILHLVP